MKYTIVADVKRPTGRRGDDAGVDFYIPNDWNNGNPLKLYVGNQVNIPTGIKMLIPEGYMLKVDNKSGVSSKKGLVIGATIIDHSYRGVIHCNMHKGVIGTEDFHDENGYYTILTPGEKIAQGILIKISDEEWEEISEDEYNAMPATSRGDKGFGSTGIK